MAAQLPVELIDKIIDDFPHDLETLEVCSRLARKWRPRSLVYLFHALEVREDNNSAEFSYQSTRKHLKSFIQMTTSRFVRFLSTRSGRNMFVHVRQLVIICRPIPTFRPAARESAEVWKTMRLPKRDRVNVIGLRCSRINKPILARLVPFLSPRLRCLSVDETVAGLDARDVLDMALGCPSLELLTFGDFSQPVGPTHGSSKAPHRPFRVAVNFMTAYKAFLWIEEHLDAVDAIDFYGPGDEASLKGTLGPNAALKVLRWAFSEMLVGAFFELTHTPPRVDLFTRPPRSHRHGAYRRT